MEFYVDLAVAVLLRLLKDKRGLPKYYAAIAKVYVSIDEASTLDKNLSDAIVRARERLHSS